MFKKDRSKVGGKFVKQAPAKVNNYFTCKTVVANSLNIEPMQTVQKRHVEEVKQIVNGKDGKAFVHKSKPPSGQKQFPAIDKSGAKKTQTRQSKKED